MYIMKNIIKCMILGIACMTLINCEDMNSVNQEYLDRGEGTYIAKIDSVKFDVGLNKVWLKWWLPGDPRIAKTEVRWVEGIEPKSREYILDRSQNDSLAIETVIKDFPEGNYTLEFINWDSEGNSSVSVTTMVEVIGDRYRTNLGQRPIALATKFGNGYAFVWGESDCLYSDLSYRTHDGETVRMRLPADNPDSAIITPRMYLYDYDGSGLYQTTYYARKTAIFSDTVIVPESPDTYVLDVLGTLTASETTILGPGNFDLGGEGIGFHDSDRNHDGSGGVNYRPNLGDFESAAVDIEGSGGNIGYTNAGEWLQYTIDVADDGYYEIDWNVSVNGGGAACHIEIDDKVFDTYQMVNNGSWNDWRYYCERNGVVPVIHHFTPGKHVVKFVFNNGGFNFNGLRIRSIDPSNILVLCSKTGWTVMVSDAAPDWDGGGKNRMIDGSYDPAQFWMSQWEPEASLPHWAIIDMQEPIEVLKVVTYRRIHDGGGFNNRLIYSITNDTNAATDPSSPSWTKIAEGAYGSSDPNIVSLTLEVAAPVAGRYLLLYIPDSFRPQWSAICEVDVYARWKDD
jgi:hypothetical protein